MKKLVGQLIVWHRLLGIGSCLLFAMRLWSGTDDDSYYYDQHHQQPLLVLRLRFLNRKHAWLYRHPQAAFIEARYTSRSRPERRLYNGLQALDFPFLYRSGPLWDVTVIALSLGGTALSITGIVRASATSGAARNRNKPAARWLAPVEPRPPDCSDRSILFRCLAHSAALFRI